MSAGATSMTAATSMRASLRVTRVVARSRSIFQRAKTPVERPTSHLVSISSYIRAYGSAVARKKNDSARIAVELAEAISRIRLRLREEAGLGSTGLSLSQVRLLGRITRE